MRLKRRRPLTEYPTRLQHHDCREPACGVRVTSVTNKASFLAHQRRVLVPNGATWCWISLVESVKMSFSLAFGEECLEVQIIKSLLNDQPRTVRRRSRGT